MDFLELISEWWKLIVGVATTLGGAISWYSVKRKNRQQSTQMLYKQLEEFKKKIILQVSTEVAQATEIGEKNRIIEGLKNHCPECYRQFMESENQGE